MTSLIQLPNELLYDIISITIYDLPPKATLKALKTLCLTHRVFVPLAQSLLFKQLNLWVYVNPLMEEKERINTNFTGISQMILSNKFIGYHVQELSITILDAVANSKKNSDNNTEEKFSNGEDVLLQIMELAANLPYVKKLYLTFSASDVDPASEWKMYMQLLDVMPGVETLELRTSQKIHTKILIMSLCKLSELRSFYLYVKDPEIFVRPGSVYAPGSSNFKPSLIKTLTVNSENTVDFVQLLDFCPQLQKLRWRGFDTEIEKFKKALEPVLSNLQKLDLECTMFGDGREPETERGISKIPKLGNLEILKKMPKLHTISVKNWIFHPDDKPSDFCRIFVSEIPYHLSWYHKETSNILRNKSLSQFEFIMSAFQAVEASNLARMRAFQMEFELMRDNSSWRDSDRTKHMSKRCELLQDRLEKAGLDVNCFAFEGTIIYKGD